MSDLRFLIIGAGAIGCFVGGKLAAVGNDVTLVGRPRTSAAVRARGLELRAADGAAHTIRVVSAVASVQEAFHIENRDSSSRSSPFDLVLFAVKSYDTAIVLGRAGRSNGSRPVARDSQSAKRRRQ